MDDTANNVVGSEIKTGKKRRSSKLVKYLKGLPFHPLGSAIAIMAIIVMVGGVALISHYAANEGIVNAGSQQWQEVGSLQGSSHKINFAACIEKISDSEWEVDSFAGISPALPASIYENANKSGVPQYVWHVSELPNDYSQPIRSAQTNEWIDGELSEEKLVISPDKPVVLHYVSPGIADSLSIDSSELNDCSSPINKGIYPVYSSSRSLSKAFLGFNAQPGDPAANWDNPATKSTTNVSSIQVNPALVNAATALHPENLRYFGGTTANYWDWKVGNYDEPVNLVGSKTLTQPIPLSDWTNLSSATHSYPLFDLNIMTPTTSPEDCTKDTINNSTISDPTSTLNECELANQISMLQTAQKQYHQTIKYLELGNEFYLSASDYPKWFPDPSNPNQADVQVYAEKANYWITKLKQAFPGAEIAVVGTWSNPAWNQGLAQYINGADAVTVHIYFGTGVNQYNDVSCKEAYCSNQANYMLANTANGGMAKTTAAIDQMAADFSQYHKAFPKVWVTEWNLEASTNLVQDSWIQGLVEAQYAIDLARDPNIELTDNHGLINNAEFGALFEAAGISIGGSTQTTADLAESAGGVTLSTLLRSLDNASYTTTLNFPDAPDISGSNAPGIEGQAFMVNGKLNVFLMNLTPNSQTIQLPPSLGSQFTQYQYFAKYKAFVSTTSTEQSPPDYISNTIGGSVTLQPFAVSSLVAK